jgi:N-acetylneuraminic acid mutarotase
MVYDAESDRVILFGGLDAADQPLDDVWAYDYNTDSWEQVASGPGGRWLQSMVYDSETDRVVVYGGIKERGCFDGAQKPKLFHDTWTYDFNGNTWTEVVSDQDSPPREGWQSAYSSAADRLLLLGSFAPAGKPRAWTYDLNANAVSTIGAFSYVPDWRSRMVYDSESDRFIVFPWSLDNYTVVYDLNTRGEDRVALPSGAAFPASIRDNSMAYVVDLDRVFLFSGYHEKGRTYPTDIWLYDLNTNTWEKVGSS